MISEFTPLELSGITNFSAYTHSSYGAMHSARGGAPQATNSSSAQLTPPLTCVASTLYPHSLHTPGVLLYTLMSGAP